MAIAKAILEQYQPSSVEEMQDALKDVFGPMFEAMLQGRIETVILIMNQTIMAIKYQTIAVYIPRD